MVVSASTFFNQRFVSQALQYGSLALAALVSISPASLTNSDFRSITRPTVVEINRASPAYAALEDVRYNYGFEQNPTTALRVMPAIKVEIETIVAGERSYLVADNEAATEPKAEPVRKLHGVSVSFENEVQAPTVREVAEVLVREELARRASETPDRKEIPTRYGKSIIVSRVSEEAKPTIAASGFQASKRDLFAPSREVKLPKGWTPSRFVQAPKYSGAVASNNPYSAASLGSGARTLAATETRRDIRDHYMDEASTSLPTMSKGLMASSASVDIPTESNAPVTADPLDIRAPIRFVGGLAFTPGQDNIEIYQEIDGAAVRQGEFFLSRGYYRLMAESLKGRIVAEVRNRDGEIIGRGEMLVADIPAARIENRETALKIAPLFDGLIGKVVAGASSFKTLPVVADAKLSIEGLNREVVLERKSELFIDKELRPGSRYLLRAQAPGYWGSLFFGESGVPFEGRVFSNKIIGALLELTSPNKFSARDNENKGVVWGRVIVDGKPLAGATVELPFEKNAKPVYFTGFLPDQNLTRTSDNGEFVFTGVERDLQVVKVSANGKAYTPIFVETAQHHVSVVDFEVQAERPVQIAAFKSFSDEPQPALMQIIGEEKTYEVLPEGTEEKMQLTRGLALAEVEGGVAYRLTRVLLNGYETEISAPLFSQEWADGFGQNLVVGQVDGDDFQVFVESEAAADLRVTYLTDTGKATEKRFGETGGGFVISGLPEGLHTVTIVPAKTKKVITQLVYVDDHAVHYFKKSLF